MKIAISKLAIGVLTIGLLSSCNEINERLDNLESRIGSIENETIASISSQIGSINSL